MARRGALCLLSLLAHASARLSYPASSGLSYPEGYPPGGSCNNDGPGDRICIAAPVSSNAVLQREPEQAAVTGSVPAGYGSDMTVRVTLTDDANPGGFQVISHIQTQSMS